MKNKKNKLVSKLVGPREIRRSQSVSYLQHPQSAMILAVPILANHLAATVNAAVFETCNPMLYNAVEGTVHFPV
jgi:hypothetical protein